MEKLPPIPKLYYFYCPSCQKMDEYLFDKLEYYDKDVLAYVCNGCDGIFCLDSSIIPTSEKMAYMTTVSILEGILGDRNDQIIRMQLNVKKTKLIEIMANSLIYSNIKAFKEIQAHLKKKEYKLASISCREMIKFIRSNSTKAKDNKLVKEFVNGKTI